MSDKKTKAELLEMLAEAVRNTQPQPVGNTQPEPVELSETKLPKTRQRRSAPAKIKTIRASASRKQRRR